MVYLSNVFFAFFEEFARGYIKCPRGTSVTSG